MIELLQTIASHTEATQGGPPGAAPCPSGGSHFSTHVPNQEPLYFLAYLRCMLGEALSPPASRDPRPQDLTCPSPHPPPLQYPPGQTATFSSDPRSPGTGQGSSPPTSPGDSSHSLPSPPVQCHSLPSLFSSKVVQSRAGVCGLSGPGPNPSSVSLSKPLTSLSLSPHLGNGHNNQTRLAGLLSVQKTR